MKKIWVAAALLPFLFLPSFAQQHLNTTIAKWEPKFEFDNELYPAFILTVSGPRSNIEIPEDYFGDPAGQAEVWITSSTPNARVHVDINIDGWATPSELDATLPKAGKRYRLGPFIRYDFVQLARTNQSYPATIRYAVSVNGVDLGWDILPIRIRSVNDVPFYAETSLDGEAGDFGVIFAGFVNESHPVVQEILQEALRSKIVENFVGYAEESKFVGLQIFAIWNALQKRRVRYSNAATPSATSPSGKVYSQAVRFIDESIDSQQANCVDGSVLFASVLYKIGIHPILIIKPGHMFVGYWLDEGHSQIEVIETTMLGEGPQPRSRKESAAQLLRAIQYATEVFNKEVQPALEQSKVGYLAVDVSEARKAGINSLPRPGR